MFRNSVLSAGCAMSALVTTVVMATLVVGPFYLSSGLGLGNAQLGLVMSAGPIVAALTGAPAGRGVDRFGAWPMTVGGLIAMLIGATVLSLLPMRFGVAGYLVPLVVITAGYALFQAANNTVVMTDARPDQRGVVAGLLNLSRNLGLITGASMMGKVFAVGSAITAIAGADANTVAAGMHLIGAVAAALIGIALMVAWAGRGGCSQPAGKDRSKTAGASPCPTEGR